MQVLLRLTLGVCGTVQAFSFSNGSWMFLFCFKSFLCVLPSHGLLELAGCPKDSARVRDVMVSCYFLKVKGQSVMSAHLSCLSFKWLDKTGIRMTAESISANVGHQRPMLWLEFFHSVLCFSLWDTKFIQLASLILTMFLVKTIELHLRFGQKQANKSDSLIKDI